MEDIKFMLCVSFPHTPYVHVCLPDCEYVLANIILTESVCACLCVSVFNNPELGYYDRNTHKRTDMLSPSTHQTRQLWSVNFMLQATTLYLRVWHQFCMCSQVSSNKYAASGYTFKTQHAKKKSFWAINVFENVAVRSSLTTWQI